MNLADEFIKDNWFFSNDIINWFSSFAYPKPLPPPAPSAPQTKEQMTQLDLWSPEIQANYNAEAWKQWIPTAIPDNEVGDESNKWVLVAVGVGALVLYFNRRR